MRKSTQLLCTQHAAERAAGTVRLELARGAASLQAIAATAPLLGMLGTVVMVREYLPEFFHPLSWGDSAGEPSDALVLTALSLPVAILATWGLRWIRRQTEVLDREMYLAALDLPGWLSTKGRHACTFSNLHQSSGRKRL